VKSIAAVLRDGAGWADMAINRQPSAPHNDSPQFQSFQCTGLASCHTLTTHRAANAGLFFAIAVLAPLVSTVIGRAPKSHRLPSCWISSLRASSCGEGETLVDGALKATARLFATNTAAVSAAASYRRNPSKQNHARPLQHRDCDTQSVAADAARLSSCYD
jgi:hypothetical protein